MRDLDNIYTYHSPKPGQPETYQAIREKAKELASLIEEVCPESREKSIAHTRIEEAVMWANASIARNEDHPVEEEEEDEETKLLEIDPVTKELTVDGSKFDKVVIIPSF